jgi:phosphatidylinositol alpha-1,6-mannosyltransferase
VSGGLRVLALVTDAWGAGGGIAQFNRDWIAAACAAGARVDVLAHGVADPQAEPLPPGARVIGARLRRLGFVRHALRAARQRPDLLFCGHLHFAPVAAWVARSAGCRWWLQLHGVEAWPRPGRLRRAAAARADLLVSVSRFTRRAALGWWDGDPWRARVLPNTVDPAFTPGPRDAALGARLGIDGSPVLLTVGRLAASEAYKGHDRILRAMPTLLARWPRLQYVVAGDGDDRPRLARLAHDAGVADRVRFVGAVDRADLPALYRLADAFAMPSTGEGFGIAFLEAMACGVPALGLDGDGSVDALGDGELGEMVGETRIVEGLVRLLEVAQARDGTLGQRVDSRFGRSMFKQRVCTMLRGLADGAA